MTTRTERETQRFWKASFFYRRATGRDTTIAVRVMEQVSRYATGTVRDRAETALREINERKSTRPQV